jgi:tetratricopeptide (TPR) repeat protein
MLRHPYPLIVGFLLLTTAVSRADDWPVPRGNSHEPLPYRYDAKLLKNIPKEYLDDSAACVLYSGTSHLIEPDGTVEMISHEITRLNSRKGIEKLGEYRSISFDPTFEKLILNEARILKANGTIVPIEPKHVQLRDVATDFQVYDQDKQLVISFPNLEVGDAYEVKWTTRGKNREFGGEFFTRYTFGDDQHPVLRDEFRVRVPRNKTLKYATVNGSANLVVTDVDGDKLYHWGVSNKAELPRDDDKPSKEELRLQVAVSTFPTWDAVANWKHKLRAECWKCMPEVRKIVDDVTRNLTTPEEKAKALTYWARRHIRYQSRGPGGLGYTPHLPHQVLSNLYGDCKDQAQLLAVMLKEIGLPVWLVTLGTLDDGQVLPEVPSPWGSHAILLTKIDGKDHWIDTTVSLAAWDFLPRGDRERQVYLTQDKSLILAKTPDFTYKDYRIEQITYVNIQADGSSKCRREVEYHGASAWSRRDKYAEVPPGERRRTVTAELQDAYSKAKLLSLKIDDKQLMDFDQPVHVGMEFEVPKHFVGDLVREGSLTDSPIWSFFLGYNFDVERTVAFQLPSPFESIHRYVVQLPITYRADSWPEERDVRSPWGFFKLRVIPDPTDVRRVELRMHMRLEKVRVEKSEFAEFQRFQDEVNRVYRVWLNLHPSVEIADAPALEKFLADQKQGDAPAAKTLAKLYLDHDRAKDAIRILDHATATIPDDKSLWELRVRAAPNAQEEERVYRAMVKRFPTEPKYAVALGTVCVRREDDAAAREILTPLTKHESSAVRGSAHYQLARSAFHAKQPEAALKHLQAALFADPTSLATNEAIQFKARVHESLGQFKEAIQALQLALETDPNARDLLEQLIRLEMHFDLHEAALDHLRRFSVAAAKDPASLVKAAELWLELGRYDEAFDLTNRAREGSVAAKAERVLGLVHLHKHDYAQAIAHLERGELDARALAGLIQAHLRLGDLDAALRRAEMIHRLEISSKVLSTLEKDVLRLAKRRDKHLQQWPDATKEQRIAATRVVNRFLCAERGLAESWPREQIDALTKDDADFGPLLALRGWLNLERGQLRKGLAEAQAAIKLQPDEARAYLVRGRVRLEQGNTTAALSDLRRATELSVRQDAVVLHWLAAALLDAGRTKEAVETQRLALLLRPNDAELRDQLRKMEKAP